MDFRIELSSQTLRKLTLFKWKYALEAQGFTTEEAEHILFLKWLMAHGGLNVYQDRV